MILGVLVFLVLKSTVSFETTELAINPQLNELRIMEKAEDQASKIEKLINLMYDLRANLEYAMLDISNLKQEVNLLKKNNRKPEEKEEEEKKKEPEEPTPIFAKKSQIEDDDYNLKMVRNEAKRNMIRFISAITKKVVTHMEKENEN